ncbi:MAG: preprotein translocase subunit YajC [Vallitaleaceae bacterium]|jgi:preprotein translocase subunit YajC|nr:preprotein translocase subunit YajC [Vallitaleaceae bacterium]
MFNLFSLLGETADTGGGNSTLFFVVIYGAFFAFMYFVLIRPQRKKQKAIESMQKSIKIGDSIITNGGLYGVVVDSVNDLFMIDFGRDKSVRVPVQKSAVAGVKEPNLTLVIEEEE